MRFHEHCATSINIENSVLSLSQSMTQILSFCDNPYTHRCGFSMPAKKILFSLETGGKWRRNTLDG